ncbi:MAG: nucleotide exchange factor GrpE [Gordonia sp. (in: high G+C Gram-positive bacteria)]|uniref:nucleotide exchange factor GrpE n=1 Tax=Gordonia sp. (in: high G+C Gram-positive bacteria) TaxID=84139 RepID=UPI003BB51855
MTEPFAGQPGAREDDIVVEAELADAAPDAETQVPADGAAPGAEQAQIAELTEALQRERAQFQNFKRRSAEEFAQAAAGGRARLLEKLLPLLDDFDRAREHGDLEDGPLKAFADKLVGVLSGEQLDKFGEPGDRFNPELHEAIQDEGSGVDPVIGTVFRPGYRVGDRVLRTAMVIVTDPEPAAPGAETPGQA